MTPAEHIYVKSYFASTIPDAIDVARSELGADALFLNSRPSPPEAHHLGAFEVVFGVHSGQRPMDPPPDAGTTGVEDLRQTMEEIRALLVRSAAIPSSRDRSRLIEQALLDAGLAPTTAAQIEESVTLRLDRRPVLEISRARKMHEWDPDSIVQETIDEIESLFSVKPELGRVTAFVGPPGTGKTTTLVKLAVTEGLLKRRAVRIISADAERIGAAEQLRSYAAILGVPFERVETPAALGQAVDNAPEGHLVLIDTPGLSPALLEGVGMDLAMFLSRRQNIDTHLVLTATMRAGDMESAAKRFEVFHPARLIFTRLDETESTGSVAGEAIRSGKPVSWICTGQLIPEDIEPASKRRITGALVRQLPTLLRSAA
jgi:flagellar biosynthesis protein FlhF